MKRFAQEGTGVGKAGRSSSVVGVRSAWPFAVGMMVAEDWLIQLLHLRRELPERANNRKKRGARQVFRTPLVLRRKKLGCLLHRARTEGLCCNHSNWHPDPRHSRNVHANSRADRNVWSPDNDRVEGYRRDAKPRDLGFNPRPIGLQPNQTRLLPGRHCLKPVEV